MRWWFLPFVWFSACGDDAASLSDAARVDAGGLPDGALPRDSGDVTRDAGPPAAPGPRWIGRVDDSDPDRVRLGWSGAGVIVRFDGTAARVRLNDSAQFFTVVVDGEVQPRLELSGGEQTYDLATGLAAGEHTVELYRRTEGFFGVTEVSMIEVDGELLSVPDPGRSIEIVGDSITCGYGNEGPNKSCGFSADTENHYETYGAIAARAVGAELSTVAWSGKGVVANYGDDRVEPMPELYDRTLASEAGDYDFPRSADVVIINLGTNDFSTDGDPTEAEFVDAYTEFLMHIRSRHPDALILCTVAPLLGGDDGDRATSYIESAIANRTGAGDARVMWIDLRTDAIGWGCDYHPSVATHRAMADLLVPILRTQLGW
jgi:lysophospholipase L1-like esterase